MANEHDKVYVIPNVDTEEARRLSMPQAMGESAIEHNAKHMYSVYRAYVKAGFIESQAFELTKITLKSFVMVKA